MLITHYYHINTASVAYRLVIVVLVPALEDALGHWQAGVRAVQARTAALLGDRQEVSLALEGHVTDVFF